METPNGGHLHAFLNANTSLSQPLLFGRRVAMKWTKDICTDASVWQLLRNVPLTRLT